MTEVYFIRHSLRDNAAYDDMDVPLTAEGEKRALILADAFNLSSNFPVRVKEELGEITRISSPSCNFLGNILFIYQSPPSVN